MLVGPFDVAPQYLPPFSLWLVDVLDSLKLILHVSIMFRSTFCKFATHTHTQNAHKHKHTLTHTLKLSSTF